MKNLLITALILIASSLFAQKNFEGIINYDIEATGPSITAEDKAKAPKSMITYYKDGKTRMEVSTPQVNLIVITDSYNESAAFMVELKAMMGMKVAIQSTKEEIMNQLDFGHITDVKHFRDKKTIAGYRCHKLQLATAEGALQAYYTDEIKAKGINWFLSEELSGIMLQYTVGDKDKNDKLIITAKQVEHTTVSDSKFNIPSDYLVISKDDLENMIEGSALF